MDKNKTVLLVGGGSGGHLTPLLAVAETIKKTSTQIKIVYVGQRGEGLADLMKNGNIDVTHSIFAGKFRRYHGESLIAHVLDLKTLILNVRDFFYFLVGLFQSWFLLRKIKPDAIFLKGGFVSVPVGISARVLRIPYVTHDSDAVPGLANRITAGHARFNTTAMPTENYPYNVDKAVHTGIPVLSNFKLVDKKSQAHAKESLGYSVDEKVVLLTGGGLGALNLNKMMTDIAGDLLTENSKLNIVHLSGKKLFSETQSAYSSSLNHEQLKQINLIDFTDKLYIYSAAADVIISRTGATTIAELAVQGKACIFVANPLLTGGQQLENAKIIKSVGGGILVEENSSEKLLLALRLLLNDEAKRNEVATNLHKLSNDNPAKKITDILLQIVERKG